MATLKEIKKDLETIEIIKNITNIYHEIANLKMKQIRERVLKNRRFFEELLNIYQKVKSAYLFSKGEDKLKKTTSSFLLGKKERVVIFLSANHFFYGNLILDIWLKVFSYFKKYKPDLVVVGKVGKYLAEASGLGHRMFYFELNDEKPEEKNLTAIVEFLKDYKKIIVFYGKYKTILSQEPILSEISELPFKEGGKEKVKTYLFEPSPETILEFFEREIMATLFHQCVLEHQLVRYAARVIAMDKARENAKKEEEKIKILENKLKMKILNKKQIELFNSLV